MQGLLDGMSVPRSRMEPGPQLGLPESLSPGLPGSSPCHSEFVVHMLKWKTYWDGLLFLFHWGKKNDILLHQRAWIYGPWLSGNWHQTMWFITPKTPQGCLPLGLWGGLRAVSPTDLGAGVGPAGHNLDLGLDRSGLKSWVYHYLSVPQLVDHIFSEPVSLICKLGLSYIYSYIKSRWDNVA